MRSTEGTALEEDVATPAQARGLRLIYVTGFARSGTTILSNLLGEIDGFTHVGELRHLWYRVLHRRGKCGCGDDLRECSFWSAVLSRTFTQLAEQNSEEFSAGSADDEALRCAYRIQQEAHGGGIRSSRDAMARYGRLMEELLSSVSRVSGARVIVDSSKVPSWGAYSKVLKRITPFYLHVVRDPRGAILSRQRRGTSRNNDGIQLRPLTTVADSLRWVGTNLKAERFRSFDEKRYLALRYEEAIRRPATSLDTIASWVGEGHPRLPITSENTACIRPAHTVWGNRNRFHTGEVPLRLDDMWITALGKRDYSMITVITAIRALKYGYRIRRKSLTGEASVI